MVRLNKQQQKQTKHGTNDNKEMTMDEGTVRMQSQMYSLVAEMESIKANIKAMEVDNFERAENGEALAWPGEMFQDASNDLMKISEKLKSEL